MLGFAGGVMLALAGTLAGCAPKRVTAPAVETDATPAAVTAAGVIVRVGLVEGSDLVTVTAPAPCELRTGATRKLVLTVAAGQDVTVRRSGLNVRWACGRNGGQTMLLVLVPISSSPPLRWNGRAWRGTFAALPTPGADGVTLVDEVDLEAYLLGVVPAEIGRPDRSRLAAVEAQAVAARTYAVSHLGTRVTRGFDLYGDVRDQVYQGVAGEDSLATVAVARSAGLVLMEDDAPIPAYFHASCGGRSAVPDGVWSRPGDACFAVSDDGPGPDGRPFCATGAHAAWTESWTAVQLDRILQSTLPDYVAYMERPDRATWAGNVFTPVPRSPGAQSPGSLRDLRIVERTASGRIACLDIVTTAGTYHVRGDRVRWVLTPASGHPTILRSALFDLEVTRDAAGLPRAVAVHGRGYGHGVGMCQNGALARAAAGQDMRAILAHYYPGATLQRFSSEALP